ncbi:MAG: GNAT family N-acetyltransferase [Pseudomonadota bacterium]
MFETDRLILRRWRKTDRPSVASILGDPDVMQFSDNGVFSVQDQSAWFNDALRAICSGPIPRMMAIVSRKDNRVLGYIGLSRDPLRVARNDAEIGFRLARHAWGKGYATEAAEAVMAACETLAAFHRVVAVVDPLNTRSVDVLKKLGMRYVKDIAFPHYDHPDHLYAKVLKSGSVQK